MAVLFVSDNFSDWIGTFAVLDTASANQFDQAVAGAAMNLTDGQTGESPAFFTDVTDEFWLHLRFSTSEYQGLNSIIELKDASDNDVYRIEQVAETGFSATWEFQYFNVTWQTVASFNVLSINTVNVLDFRVVPGAASAGEFQFYFNNVLTVDDPAVTIDPSNGTDLNYMILNNAVAGFGVTTTWSEVIVTDTDPTLEWRLQMLNPDGAGAHAEWTNGALGDIDEIALDVSDFIDTTTAAQRDSYTMSDIDASINSSFEPVEVHTFYDLFRGGASPIANFESFIRTPVGTDSTFTTITQPPADINTKRRVTYANDPTDGGAAWTQTKVNGL